MGFSYQKATNVSDKQDDKLREYWINVFFPRIVRYCKKHDCQLFFEDETFFRQWGSLSYTWSPTGCQPVIESSGDRRTYKTFGVIDFWSGQFIYECTEGSLNSDSYIRFLERVLRESKGKFVVIQDNAGYHRSKDLREFLAAHQDRIKMYQLPPYSPDFNPIEKLWKKIKKAGTHLKHFPTFDDLRACVDTILNQFKGKPEEVLSLFASLRKKAGVQEA